MQSLSTHNTDKLTTKVHNPRYQSEKEGIKVYNNFHLHLYMFHQYSRVDWHWAKKRSIVFRLWRYRILKLEYTAYRISGNWSLSLPVVPPCRSTISIPAFSFVCVWELNIFQYLVGRHRAGYITKHDLLSSSSSTRMKKIIKCEPLNDLNIASIHCSCIQIWSNTIVNNFTKIFFIISHLLSWLNSYNAIMPIWIQLINSGIIILLLTVNMQTQWMWLFQEKNPLQNRLILFLEWFQHKTIIPQLE